MTCTLCKNPPLPDTPRQTYHGLRQAQLLEQRVAAQRGIMAEEVSDKGAHGTGVRCRSERQQKEWVIETWSDNCQFDEQRGIKRRYKGKRHDNQASTEALPRDLSSSVQP